MKKKLFRERQIQEEKTEKKNEEVIKEIENEEERPIRRGRRRSVK